MCIHQALYQSLTLFFSLSLSLSFLLLPILTDSRVTRYASSLFFVPISSGIHMPIYRGSLKGMDEGMLQISTAIIPYDFWSSCINDHHNFMITMPLRCYLLIFCLFTDKFAFFFPLLLRLDFKSWHNFFYPIILLLWNSSSPNAFPLASRRWHELFSLLFFNHFIIIIIFSFVIIISSLLILIFDIISYL